MGARASLVAMTRALDRNQGSAAMGGAMNLTPSADGD
jgi:hypothetical protein